MPLEFRNLSVTMRVGFSTRRCQPPYINLAPGQTRTINEAYMTEWPAEVKEDVAAYVEKGVLQVWDTTLPGALSVAQIIAY
jgi:hypothetical protein